MKETTKDLILRLRRIKEQEHLSVPMIADMIKDNGDFISTATINRVMKEGNEDVNFRYYDTLQPIAKVLLKLDKDHMENLTDEERASKDILLIKDMEYHALKEKYETLEAESKKKIAYLTERVNYLKEQVAIHQAAIERKDEQIATRDISISKRDQVIENLSRIAVIAVEKEQKE